MTPERIGEAYAVRAGFNGNARATALSRLGLREDQLLAMGTALGGQIAEALGRGDASLLLGFQRGYMRTERKLRLERHNPSEIEPDPLLERPALPGVPDPRQIRPLPKREQPAPVAANAAEPKLVPSYLRAEDEQQRRLPPTPGAPIAPPPPPPSPVLPDADETGMVDPFKAAEGMNLPFDPNSPLAKLMRLRAEAAAAKAPKSPPAVPEGARISGDPGGTISLPDGIPGITGARPLPFGESKSRSDQVDLSTFPIERYAEVTVALATSDDRASILRRYLLTEVMWKAFAQAWGTRVTKDPALRAQFDAAVKRARGQ